MSDPTLMPHMLGLGPERPVLSPFTSCTLGSSLRGLAQSPAYQDWVLGAQHCSLPHPWARIESCWPSTTLSKPPTLGLDPGTGTPSGLLCVLGSGTGSSTQGLGLFVAPKMWLQGSGTSIPLPPSFQTCGEPQRPNDIVPWATSGPHSFFMLSHQVIPKCFSEPGNGWNCGPPYILTHKNSPGKLFYFRLFSQAKQVVLFSQEDKTGFALSEASACLFVLKNHKCGEGLFLMSLLSPVCWAFFPSKTFTPRVVCIQGLMASNSN